MPGSPLKICAMPTASDVAPPVRPATRSPTSASIVGRSTVGWLSYSNTAGGVLMAK